MVSQDASEREKLTLYYLINKLICAMTTLNDLFEGVARFPLQATYEEFVARTLQLMNEFLVATAYTEQSTKSMTLDLWTIACSLSQFCRSAQSCPYL